MFIRTEDRTSDYWIDEFLRQSYLLIDARRYREAIERCNGILRIQPDCYEAENNLSIALGKLNRYVEAVARYEKILKIQPNSYEVWNNQGIMLNGLDRYHEAIASYNRARELQPNAYVVWNNRGYSLVKLTRYKDALNSYKRAIAIRYDYHEAWHNRGNVESMLGHHWVAFFCYCQAWRFHPGWSKLGNALRDFSRYSSIAIKGLVHYSDAAVCTIGDYAIAGSNYFIKLIRKPDYHAAWNQTIITLGNLGNSSDTIIRKVVRYSDVAICTIGDYAIAVFNYFIELIPRSAPEIKPTNDKYWFNLGNQLKEVERNKEAIDSYDKAVTINPNNYEAHYKCGLALLELRRDAEALQSFDLVLRIKPDYSAGQYNRNKVLSNLERFKEEIERYNQTLTFRSNDYEVYYKQGSKLWSLGRFLEAIAKFNQALNVAPFNLEDWYHRGKALLNLKRYLEAIASFEQALKINAGYHKAWYERGFALHQLERYEEAINSFDQALAINPSYYEAWYSRGLALHSIGRYQQAIDSFDKCLQLQPRNYSALNEKGLALYRSGRYQESSDCFKQALVIQSNNHEIWYNLGNALKDCGRYPEAIESFKKALQLKQELFWPAWNNLGWAVFKLSGYQEALKKWNTGLKKVSSNNVLLKALLYYHFSEQISLIYSLAIYLYRTQVNTLVEPEGCGVIYHSIARAHYQYGQQQKNHYLYWKKAKFSYKYALKYLTADQFCHRRLEVLKDLIRLCRDLGEVKEVDALGLDGSDLLARLLKETPSVGKQSLLRLEFLDFARLRVDQLAQSPKTKEQREALELAEYHKNLCLGYCLYNQNPINIDSPKYSDIQALLKPNPEFDVMLKALSRCRFSAGTSLILSLASSLYQIRVNTAVIYWHISPAAITTFILRFQKPLVIWTYSRVQNSGRHFLLPLSTLLSLFAKKAELKGFVYPPATRQIQDFEAWVKEWKKQYQEYRDIRKVEHPWRKGMEQQLKQLERILNVPALSRKLKDVSQLILIPHRDLHLLPIDALFPERFTITYLPSVQVGINLRQPKGKTGLRLLSVENPRNDLAYANIESAIIIKQFYPDSPPALRGQQATKSQVINTLQADKQLGVFHFTGHARHDINQPLESALLLADRDKLSLRNILQPEFDIKLKSLIYRFHSERISFILWFIYFLHLIQGLPLNLSHFRLVCLSACETGFTSTEDLINEFVGLVSGFLGANVTSVVSSLWLVYDLSTAFFMIEFYANLNRGDCLGVALNKAKKWLRTLTIEEFETVLAQLKPEIEQVFAQLPKSKYVIFKASLEQIRKRKPYPFANPYYWAAFTATGF